MKQQSNRLTPNRFELKGKHTEITYETTGFDGQARLNYRVFQGPATRTFTGDQLSSENTRIGTLVTVTLEAQPDLETTTLTLVVPIINLVDATELAFKTLAIITTQRNSIGGPGLVNGIVQGYHVVPLEGRAQFVEF